MRLEDDTIVKQVGEHAQVLILSTAGNFWGESTYEFSCLNGRPRWRRWRLASEVEWKRFLFYSWVGQTFYSSEKGFIFKVETEPPCSCNLQPLVNLHALKVKICEEVRSYSKIEHSRKGSDRCERVLESAIYSRAVYSRVPKLATNFIVLHSRCEVQILNPEKYEYLV